MSNPWVVTVVVALSAFMEILEASDRLSLWALSASMTAGKCRMFMTWEI